MKSNEHFYKLGSSSKLLRKDKYLYTMFLSLVLFLVFLVSGVATYFLGFSFGVNSVDAYMIAEEVLSLPKTPIFSGFFFAYYHLATLHLH